MVTRDMRPTDHALRTLAQVSRIFWVGVGAAGGIFAYRKANETISGVRERTLRENLTKVARTASNVAASARYLAALTADDKDADVVDIRPVPAPRGKDSRQLG
jgi:hypothetical protein